MTPYYPQPLPATGLRSITLVLVSDDPALVRRLLSECQSTPDLTCMGIFSCYEQPTIDILELTPDIVVMDLGSHCPTGIRILKHMARRSQLMQSIVLVPDSAKEQSIDALYAGARGALLRNSSVEVIADAIREIVEGGTPLSSEISRIVVSHLQCNQSHSLTPREHDVLHQLCEGKSYKMISSSLYISQDTVRSHIKSLYRKLDVNSKSEAVAKALRNHWV